MRQRGIQAVRVLMGLVSLTDRHPARALERACQVAASHGAYHLRDIRNLTKRARLGGEQQMLPFIEEHEVIRP